MAAAREPGPDSAGERVAAGVAGAAVWRLLVADEIVREREDWSGPVQIRFEYLLDGRIEMWLREAYRKILGEGELEVLDPSSDECWRALRLGGVDVHDLVEDALDPVERDMSTARYGRWRVVLERVEEPRDG